MMYSILSIITDKYLLKDDRNNTTENVQYFSCKESKAENAHSSLSKCDTKCKMPNGYNEGGKAT